MYEGRSIYLFLPFRDIENQFQKDIQFKWSLARIYVEKNTLAFLRYIFVLQNTKFLTFKYEIPKR